MRLLNSFFEFTNLDYLIVIFLEAIKMPLKSSFQKDKP